MDTKRWLMRLGLAGAIVLPGCASVDPEFRDPRDPFESFNRAMYRFNDGLDKAIVKPVARGYVAIVPTVVDKGVTNFFGNLDDIGSALNNFLQLKFNRAFSDVGRVMVNTTVGVLGFMDVASNLDLPKHDEDFGQTLGSWGIGPGPFIVLPIVGPSSGRDAIGEVVDWYTDPLTYLRDGGVAWGLKGLRLIDRRADLLAASRVFEQAALDPYVFIRDAYLQKRRHDVFDGNPPPEDEATY
ncbi:MAG: VacJ family lipoprotein [Gammaproteobacteria bacterium]|jgi:phospholipid-binding lipoprotein MlaA